MVAHELPFKGAFVARMMFCGFPGHIVRIDTGESSGVQSR